MTIKLDGVGIMVKDIKSVALFYKNALGFDIDWREGEPNVYLVKDSTVFMLYGREDFERMTRKKFTYAGGLNGHFEIALSVRCYAEVDAAYQKAVLKGAEPVMPPETMPWGQRTSYVADPEGNLIEIGSFDKV